MDNAQTRQRDADRDTLVKNVQDSARRIEAAKIARLREMRLSKEAADRTAVAGKASLKKKPRVRAAAASAPPD